MIEVIIFAIIIASIQGKNVLGLLLFPESILLLIGVVLYITMILLELFDKPNIIKKYIQVLMIVISLPIVILVFRFKLFLSFVIGLVLFIIGCKLNYITVNQNYGKMPIFPSLSFSTKFVTKENITSNNTHQLGNEYTKYILFSDIFDFGYNIFSLGDFCIFSIYGIIIYQSICRIS